jgi:hypothetical protein
LPGRVFGLAGFLRTNQTKVDHTEPGASRQRRGGMGKEAATLIGHIRSVSWLN